MDPGRSGLHQGQLYLAASSLLTHNISPNEYKYLRLPSKFSVMKFSVSSFSEETYLKGGVNFSFFHCWFLDKMMREFQVILTENKNKSRSLQPSGRHPHKSLVPPPAAKVGWWPFCSSAALRTPSCDHLCSGRRKPRAKGLKILEADCDSHKPLEMLMPSDPAREFLGRYPAGTYTPMCIK